MSAQIVNLHRARKAKARTDAAAQAAENRVKFGRTKGQKAQEAALTDQGRRHLEGHRLDTSGPDQS